jgi:hypothetical protein
MTSVTTSSTRGGQKNLDFRNRRGCKVYTIRACSFPLPFLPSHPKNWRVAEFHPCGFGRQRHFQIRRDDRATIAELTDIIKRSCAAFRSHRGDAAFGKCGRTRHFGT